MPCRYQTRAGVHQTPAGVRGQTTGSRDSPPSTSARPPRSCRCLVLSPPSRPDTRSRWYALAGVVTAVSGLHRSRRQALVTRSCGLERGPSASSPESSMRGSVSAIGTAWGRPRWRVQGDEQPVSGTGGPLSTPRFAPRNAGRYRAIRFEKAPRGERRRGRCA